MAVYILVRDMVSYQREEIDDELSVASESEKSSAAQVLVRLKTAAVFSSHGIHKVWSEHKWSPLSLEALDIAEANFITTPLMPLPLLSGCETIM